MDHETVEEDLPLDTRRLHTLLRFATGRMGRAERSLVRKRLERDATLRDDLSAIERIRDDFEVAWSQFAAPLPAFADASIPHSFFESLVHWVHASRELLPNGLTLVPAFQGTAGLRDPVARHEQGTSFRNPWMTGPGVETGLLRSGDLVIGKLIHEEKERRLTALVFVDRIAVRACQLTLIHEGQRMASAALEEVEGASYALAAFEDVPAGVTIYFELIADFPGPGSEGVSR